MLPVALVAQPKQKQEPIWESKSDEFRDKTRGEEEVKHPSILPPPLSVSSSGLMNEIAVSVSYLFQLLKMDVRRTFVPSVHSSFSSLFLSDVFIC